jgi:hypothetical protein
MREFRGLGQVKRGWLGCSRRSERIGNRFQCSYGRRNGIRGWERTGHASGRDEGILGWVG